MKRDVLVAKIDSRTRGIVNLTVIRNAQQSSLDKLIQQTGEHEVNMSECPGRTPRQLDWLKWANYRLTNMNDQRQHCQREVDATNASIGRLQAEVNGFQREVDEIDAAKEREVKKTLRATIAAVEGREVGKNPHRRYVPKGAPKKASAEPKPSKKDKAQQGHKQGKGHQRAA